MSSPSTGKASPGVCEELVLLIGAGEGAFEVAYVVEVGNVHYVVDATCVTQGGGNS